MDFIELVKFGRFAEAIELMKTPQDLIRTDLHGRSAIYYAASQGRKDIILQLVQMQADVNQAAFNGETALHVCALRGHREAVIQLIDCKADINCFDFDRETPLFVATRSHHEPVVHELLKKKADPNEARTIDGMTPLFLAVESFSFDLCEALLSCKADVNHKKSLTGQTPLIALCSLDKRAQEAELSIAKLLLESRAQVNVVDQSGQTALSSLLKRQRLKFNMELLHTLLEHGADLNAIQDNESVLNLAIRFQNGPYVISVLLQRKADPNCISDSGQTPLSLAATLLKNNEYVDLLLQARADPNQQSQGHNLLDRACQGGDYDLIQLLVKYNAQPSVPLQRSPLYFAVQHGDVELVKNLLERNAIPRSTGFTEMDLAVLCGQREVADLLAKAKAQKYRIKFYEVLKDPFFFGPVQSIIQKYQGHELSLLPQAYDVKTEAERNFEFPFSIPPQTSRTFMSPLITNSLFDCFFCASTAVDRWKYTADFWQCSESMGGRKVIQLSSNDLFTAVKNSPLEEVALPLEAVAEIVALQARQAKTAQFLCMCHQFASDSGFYRGTMGRDIFFSILRFASLGPGTWQRLTAQDFRRF